MFLNDYQLMSSLYSLNEFANDDAFLLGFIT